MAAPEGNEFWKLRSKHGRDKLFQTEELMRQASQEYFEWCDANPWYKHEAIKSGDLAGSTVQIPTARPYTITGFLIFIGASESYWRQFKHDCKEKKAEGFLTVIDEIETVIYTQKFEGAAVGAFNANIIARDLGLADKSEHTGKDGEPLYQQPIINVFTTPKSEPPKEELPG